ncbi:MAG: caspase family protein [Candidatus Melainabacteria bacterium]|nr:caspase family protein [Candidatus Melainabacteria bacterium]
MGSSIVRIGGLSIPILVGALFAGENNVDSKKPPVLKAQGINVQLNQPLTNRGNEYALTLREIYGFESREIYIRNLLEKLNPQLLSSVSNFKDDTALSSFNKKHDLSLVCIGIKSEPAEFVFIDNNYFLGKSQIPLRVALTYEEVTNIKTKQSLEQLLEKKLSAHINDMCEQYAVWSEPYQYDFQKNSGACMFALSLEGLSGMETDLARVLETYRRDYGMSLSALCIDDIHKEELLQVLGDEGFCDIPEIVSGTKSEILRQLESSLKKAIDEKKSVFMFHYMNHGNEDGGILASDYETMEPKEIAEIISRPYKGQSLCAQIDITIWAGSCFSGSQLDGIKNYFQERKEIPVKNLRIITESKYTSAGAGTTPENASLVSDLMTDKSGPLDYYCSWYKEYLQHLTSKGVKIERPVGTYLHKIKFADLMTQYDTSNRQDSQGFHYSNDPKTKKLIEQYFTQTKPNISVNNYMQNVA